MSAFGGKADMLLHCTCLLLTLSGQLSLISRQTKVVAGGKVLDCTTGHLAYVG